MDRPFAAGSGGLGFAGDGRRRVRELYGAFRRSQNDADRDTADLVARLGVTSASDLSYLRERLLAKHMIRAAGRGRVAFTLPGTAAWLGAGTPRRSLPPPRS